MKGNKKEKKVNKKLRAIVCGAVLIGVIAAGSAAVVIHNGGENSTKIDKIKGSDTSGTTTSKIIDITPDESDIQYADNYVSDVKNNNNEYNTTSSSENIVDYKDSEHSSSKLFSSSGKTIYNSLDDVDWSKLKYGDLVWYNETDNNGTTYVKYIVYAPEMDDALKNILEMNINNTKSFGVQTCVNAVVDDVSTTTLLDEFVFYDKNTKKCTDKNGSPIDFAFDTSNCQNSVDFLEKYLYKRYDLNFSIDNVVSNNQPYDTKFTYHFDSNDCSNYVEKIKKDFMLSKITDCNYIFSVMNTASSDVEQNSKLNSYYKIDYITITISGINNDGKSVSVFTTFGLSYE